MPIVLRTGSETRPTGKGERKVRPYGGNRQAETPVVRLYLLNDSLAKKAARSEDEEDDQDQESVNVFVFA